MSDLRHISLEKEDEKAWHAKDARDGKTFPIAKKGLSKEMFERVAKHFAKGGEADSSWGIDLRPTDSYLQFGKTPDEAIANIDNSLRTIAKLPKKGADDSANVSALKAAEKNAFLAQQPMALRDYVGEELRGLDAADRGSNAAIMANTFAPPPGPPPANFNIGSTGVVQAPESISLVPQAETEGSRRAMMLHAPTGVVAPQGQGPAAAEVPAPAPAATTTPKESAQPKRVGENLTGEAIKAEQARVGAAQQQADALVGIQQKFDQDRQTAQQEWKQRWQDNQARADRIAQDIGSGKLEPGRFWNNMPMEQKVTAGIALVLGGLGQAFGGGPNPALAWMDKAIDRDIDAQKNDLGKKQGLLSHYMQQGHDLQSAQQLAKADMNDAFAAQMQIQATKYAPKETAIEAQKNIVAIKANAAAMRAKAMQQGFENNIKLLDAQAKLAAAGASGPGAQLQKKFQQDVAEIQDRRNNIQQAVDRLKKAIGASGTFEAMGPHNELLNQDIELIATDMAKLKDPNSVARPAEVEQFKSMLFKPGLGTRNSTAQAILDAFSKKVEDTTQNAYSVRGIPQPQAGTPGAGISTGAQKQTEMLQWAKANQGKDPRADEMLRLLGAK